MFCKVYKAISIWKNLLFVSDGYRDFLLIFIQPQYLNHVKQYKTMPGSVKVHI